MSKLAYWDFKLLWLLTCWKSSSIGIVAAPAATQSSSEAGVSLAKSLVEDRGAMVCRRFVVVSSMNLMFVKFKKSCS